MRNFKASELIFDMKCNSNKFTQILSAILPEADTPVSRFKDNVTRLINVERQNHGVAELKAMDAIAIIADIRAKESADVFEHTRPDGTRCFSVFAEHAFRYRAAGENLAFGFRKPEAVVTAWMKSEGHRRNLLDPDYNYVGIGYYVNEKGTIYCSALLYTPKFGK